MREEKAFEELTQLLFSFLGNVLKCCYELFPELEGVYCEAAIGTWWARKHHRAAHSLKVRLVQAQGLLCLWISSTHCRRSSTNPSKEEERRKIPHDRSNHGYCNMTEVMTSKRYNAIIKLNDFCFKKKREYWACSGRTKDAFASAVEIWYENQCSSIHWFVTCCLVAHNCMTFCPQVFRYKCACATLAHSFCVKVLICWNVTSVHTTTNEIMNRILKLSKSAVALVLCRAYMEPNNGGIVPSADSTVWLSLHSCLKAKVGTMLTCNNSPLSV